jgi:hypothetical protein
VKKRLSDQYKTVSKSANVPRDLMHDDENITDSSDDDSTTATCAQCNNPNNSTSTTNINFNELVTNKKMIRNNIETTTATGQQKQAVQVHKGRHWNGGENLLKDTGCTLKLSRDRNKIGIKTLLVVITQVVYYKKTDQL